MSTSDQRALMSHKSLHLFHVTPHSVIKYLVWTVNLFITDSKSASRLMRTREFALTLVGGDIFFKFCSFQLVLPEYLIHFFFCVMFFCAAEWLTLCLNLPLLAYHVWRWVSRINKSIVSLQCLVHHYNSAPLMQHTAV